MDFSIKMNDTAIKFYKFELGPINLELEKGMAMAYLGRNGAGKTTTLNMIAGLLSPYSGAIEVMGYDTKKNHEKWKTQIGFVDSSPRFYYTKPMRHLKFLSSFYPNWSWDLCHRVAKVLHLDLDDKIHHMSKGQKMKLSIVGELAKQPNLLLLDEPMDGLDPIVRDDFAELLYEYMENEEHSLIYSTHIIPEIERMVDKVTLLDNGKIMSSEYKEDMIEKWRKFDLNISSQMDSKPFIVKQEDKSDFFTITTDDYEECRKHFAELNIEVKDSHFMTIQEIVLTKLR